MTDEEKEALLALKAAGWRPLISVGGTPVGGLTKTVYREDYPWIPSLIAPPNRAHEELFR